MRYILRKSRKDLRYSIRHVAERTGLSQDYIMKVELGRQTPSFTNAEIIYDNLRKMGLSPDIGIRELFEDDGVKK